jgi:rusticyanin
MKRTRLAAVTGAAAFAAAGLAGGGVIAACSSPGPGSSAVSTPSAAGTAGGYSWYRSMMGTRYPGQSGSMMAGNSYGWMMGSSGYRWMTGGRDAPAWMRGHALPGFMMGASGDAGKVMGALFAGAPGPRVSQAAAARLGNAIPVGAIINRAARQITFSGTTARITAVASPAGGPDETFRIAGLVNPAITVRAGTRVSIQVINADPDTAHGLVIASRNAGASWMPMMTTSPAFTGAALWFLGNPTSAGMHQATLGFTAATAGHYSYLCPVPGHAQKGMTGSFTVS